MIINILNSCLFYEFDNGKFNILAHCVNCQRKMGSGIAKQVKNRYNVAYEKYINNQKLKLLGDSQIVEIGEYRYVANVYGQEFYGNEKGKVYVDYNALLKALHKTFSFAKERDYTIGFPYLFASDRAGGDWDGKILPMIEELSNTYNVDVFIVRQPLVENL